MLQKNPLQKMAQSLRRSQTDAEKVIWSLVRNKQLGYKFQRQKPFDHYIVDFICAEKHLVIEVDGGQHTKENDHIRTTHIEKQGFKILRFWNHDVLNNKEGVFLKIAESLQAPSPASAEAPASASSTSPAARGGEVRKSYAK